MQHTHTLINTHIRMHETHTHTHTHTHTQDSYTTKLHTPQNTTSTAKGNAAFKSLLFVSYGKNATIHMVRLFQSLSL